MTITAERQEKLKADVAKFEEGHENEIQVRMADAIGPSTQQRAQILPVSVSHFYFPRKRRLWSRWSAGVRRTRGRSSWTTSPPPLTTTPAAQRYRPQCLDADCWLGRSVVHATTLASVPLCLIPFHCSRLQALEALGQSVTELDEDALITKLTAQVGTGTERPCTYPPCTLRLSEPWPPCCQTLGCSRVRALARNKSSRMLVVLSS